MSDEKPVNVRPASDYGLDQLSEGAIRAVFQPARAFRISPAKYPPGARIGGATREGLWFIVGGRGELKSPAPTEFHAGQVVEIPDGEFELTVLGAADLEMVKVWRLPEEFWAHQ